MRYFILLLLLVLCLDQVMAQEEYRIVDSLEHSISGYESYLAPAFMDQHLIGYLPVRDISRFTLLASSSFYQKTNDFYYQQIPSGETFVRIDGMTVRNANAFPFRSIHRAGVFTNNTPIQLGGSLAGYTIIETPKPSDSLTINLEYLTSEPFNSLGHHLIELDLSAPLRFSENQKYLPSIYFAVNYSTTRDYDPSWTSHHQLTGEAQDELETHPLVPSPASDAFIVNAETFTEEKWEEHDFRQTEGNHALNSFIKLKFPLWNRATLTLGSYIQSDKRAVTVYENELFNSSNNPQQHTRNFDNYVRLSHIIKQTQSFKIEYQAQLNYASNFTKIENPNHGKQFFDYGYLGEYNIHKAPIYNYGVDEISGHTGWQMLGYQDTRVTYEAGSQNPVLANYTSTYYQLAGDEKNGYYESLDQILINNGLLNGTDPRNPHSLWHNAGRQADIYREDLKTYLTGDFLLNTTIKDHHFKVGFSATKSKEQYYQIRPVRLWGLMRQLANNHISQLDMENPLLLINGNIYEYDDPNAPAFGPVDTILYNRLYIAGQQSFFDKSLRKKLGMVENSTEFINTDGLSPNMYSLDMFSTEELLNNGTSFVSYSGYSYSGDREGNPTYRDFFYKQDENGNYTRDNPAFEPFSMSAYGEYQYYHKWFDVIAGIRLDRYDANQPVLRDKYFIYQSDIKSMHFNFDESFVDYDPQINVLPQVHFSLKSFKSTKPYFKYVSMTENPTLGSRFDPYQYYYFEEIASNRILNNPNLKPTRANKLSVGIKQKIYKNLKVDFGYYRNWLKNPLGFELVEFAYPRQYVAYANLPNYKYDGLITRLYYNSPKSSGVNAAITYDHLLRSVPVPDVRNVLNAFVQFNCGYGKDYIGLETKKGYKPLEGLGLSLLYHMRSGAFYSKQATPTAEGFISYTPNIFINTNKEVHAPNIHSIDFKIEKGFNLANNKIQLSIYVWIQNLINKRNALKIYAYTGEPDDDGYLLSVLGQQDLESQVNSESYADQYAIKVDDPANYDIPRIVRWGVIMKFN